MTEAELQHAVDETPSRVYLVLTAGEGFVERSNSRWSSFSILLGTGLGLSMARHCVHSTPIGGIRTIDGTTSLLRFGQDTKYTRNNSS